MNSMKRQKDMILKYELPGHQVPDMLLEISGEITPERMKRQRQRKKEKQKHPVVDVTGDGSPML